MNRRDIEEMIDAIAEASNALQPLAAELEEWKGQYLGGGFDAVTLCRFQDLYDNWRQAVEKVGAILEAPKSEIWNSKPLLPAEQE